MSKVWLVTGAGHRPALEARLEELRAYEALSKSTDGSFRL